ncbi:MAG TPA: hypothetical protein VF026_13270, partial [Ktedonobacteraceae bacterium]
MCNDRLKGFSFFFALLATPFSDFVGVNGVVLWDAVWMVTEIYWSVIWPSITSRYIPALQAETK